jgi:starch-binding outer membrane protein, SusD/RagB family
MKYTKWVLLSAFIAVVSANCNKTYLTVPALGQLNEKDLYTYKGVQSLLIATYSLLDGMGSQANVGAAGTSNHYYGSICGSEAYKGSYFTDQTDITSLELFNTNSGNSYLAGKWQAVYEGVEDANIVLRVLKKVTDITPEQTTEIKAEALFLRAFYHFEAKKIWNKIPFIDENVTFEAGNYHVANDTSWTHIENDLDTAIAYLPDTQIPEIARVNRFAAEAFLAKVYLFEHKYQLARPLLTDLTVNGKTSSGQPYKLEDHFADNFDPAKKNGSESVFAAQSSVNDGSSGLNGNFSDAQDLIAANDAPGGCCGFFNPSQYLVNHFKTDPVTGLPDLDNFNLRDVTNDENTAPGDLFTPDTSSLDPRLDWTVGRRGIPYLDWGIEPGKSWLRDADDYCCYVGKKYLYYKSQQGEYTDNNVWGGGVNIATANNINLIRFADVLLWAAEVEILSPDGDLEKARGYVNQVRTRAMNPDGWVHTYLDNNDPGKGSTNIPAANYKIDIYKTAWTDPLFALKALQYERMLELGLEGHRFFDLVRWGIASESIESYFDKEKIKRYYLKEGHFKKGINEYFPIPLKQIDLSAGADGNQKMTQNPGY